MTEEEAKRDDILDAMEQRRRVLLAVAKGVAGRIERTRGRVTAVEVLADMRDCGFGPQMAMVDSRWAGAIFRRGWTRIGYESKGSHARPVSVWRKTKEGE